MRHRRHSNTKGGQARPSAQPTYHISRIDPLTLIQVIELLTNLTAAVKRNEPDVFTFHLYKDFDAETNKEQLVLVEK